MPTRPNDLLDRFEIDTVAPGPPVGGSAEPQAAVASGSVEGERIGSLDPARAGAEADRPPLPARRRRVPFGPLASLAVHLSPLLFLLSWSSSPAEIAAPIPVQLVLEGPPPPPPPPPAPIPKPKPPLAARLASEDVGEKVSPEPRPTATEPVKAAAEPPNETKLAALQPPAKALPKSDLVSALPPPAATPEPLPAPQDIKLPLMASPPAAPERKPPPKRPPAKEMASTWPLPLHPRSGRVPGPAAVRDEYLAYCEALIRRFYGMLSSAFLAGRRGETTVTIMILPDGTIARIAVTQSSGYPDIDDKIEEMVAAVRRFPPLPARFQGPGAVFRFHKAFP